MPAKRKIALQLSDDDWLAYRKQFRKLSNSARYEEAYALAKRLLKKHPREILFAYYEAVMSAEDDVGYSEAELRKRYKGAAIKLRRLLYRVRAMSPGFRKSVRNEYYWFSCQPLKQYRLGQEDVRKGDKSGYYSQGVGAAQLAKKYALKRQVALAIRWAKASEKAWLAYFAFVPDWYNSYLFYAAALGYQGRLKEMDAAFSKAAKIAGKSSGWKAIHKYRSDVEKVLAAMGKQ